MPLRGSATAVAKSGLARRRTVSACTCHAGGFSFALVRLHPSAGKRGGWTITPRPRELVTNVFRGA